MTTTTRKPARARKPPQDHRARVDGKMFVWTTEDGAKLTIPLRIKMRVLRKVGDGNLDADGMFLMLEALVPDQVDVMDDMDVNDFTAAFGAWQAAYNQQNGATPGEASGSSPS